MKSNSSSSDVFIYRTVNTVREVLTHYFFIFFWGGGLVKCTPFFFALFLSLYNQKMGFQMESEIKRVTEIAENLPKFDWIAAQNEPVGFFFKHNPYGRGSRTNYQAINPNCIGGGATELWGFN